MKAWEELSDPLKFQIGGKTYTAPELDMDTGLLALSILNGQASTEDWPADRPLSDLFRMVLGDTWEQMRTDKAPLAAMERAGLAAVTDIQQGREAAVKMWEEGVDPEVWAALEAATDSTNSTGTESESGTPTPDSTSPTTSPKTTRSTPPRKAASPRRSGPSSSTASN